MAMKSPSLSCLILMGLLVTWWTGCLIPPTQANTNNNIVGNRLRARTQQWVKQQQAAHPETPRIRPIQTLSTQNQNQVKSNVLNYYGGPIVAGPISMHVLTWGPVSGVQLVPELSSFLGAIGGTSWWNILLQYGTPSQPSISTSSLTVLPPVALVETVTESIVDDALIQTTLTQAINNGQFTISTNDIFTVLFPAGLSLTSKGTESCYDFCAYHGTVQVNGTYIGYIILPDQSTGRCNGLCGSRSVFENSCQVLSHELADTVTNVAHGLATTLDAPLGWFHAREGEVGDICSGYPGSVVGTDGQTYGVQQIWSNNQGRCVDTEVPMPARIPIPDDDPIFGLFVTSDGSEAYIIDGIASGSVTVFLGAAQASGYFNPITRTGDITFPDHQTYNFTYYINETIIFSNNEVWTKFHEPPTQGPPTIPPGDMIHGVYWTDEVGVRASFVSPPGIQKSFNVQWSDRRLNGRGTYNYDRGLGRIDIGDPFDHTTFKSLPFAYNKQTKVITFFKNLATWQKINNDDIEGDYGDATITVQHTSNVEIDGITVNWRNTSRPQASGYFNQLTGQGNITFPDDSREIYQFTYYHNNTIGWKDGLLQIWKKTGPTTQPPTFPVRTPSPIDGVYEDATIVAIPGEHNLIIVNWRNEKNQSIGHFDILTGTGDLTFSDGWEHTFTYDDVNQQIVWSDNSIWKKTIIPATQIPTTSAPTTSAPIIPTTQITTTSAPTIPTTRVPTTSAPTTSASIIEGSYGDATIVVLPNNPNVILLTWRNGRPQAAGHFNSVTGQGDMTFPDDSHGLYTFTYDYVNNQIIWSNNGIWKKITIEGTYDTADGARASIMFAGSFTNTNVPLVLNWNNGRRQATGHFNPTTNKGDMNFPDDSHGPYTFTYNTQNGVITWSNQSIWRKRA